MRTTEEQGATCSRHCSKMTHCMSSSQRLAEPMLSSLSSLGRRWKISATAAHSKCSAQQEPQSTILTLGSAYLILAEFMEGNKIRSRSFDLSIDEMRTNDLKEPDEKSVCQREKVLYQRAFSVSRDFTDDRAADYMRRKFVFQALGKVGFTEDFRTIVRMVEQQGESSLPSRCPLTS